MQELPEPVEKNKNRLSILRNVTYFHHSQTRAPPRATLCPNVLLLKLNSLCMSDSTLGSYVILRALINGKRCYDKFYVYRHCGEIRIGNKLAEKLGLERTSHSPICLPQTFEDHNPKVENFDLKVAKFNASFDGE